MKKYELTANSIEINGHKLYQIKALIDIPNVCKVADLGGYIESEKNLSHDGYCWVSGNAWVSGDAQVSGNAQVFGDAQVSEDAWVSGNAWVYGDARVFGDTLVFGDAKVNMNSNENAEAINKQPEIFMYSKMEQNISGIWVELLCNKIVPQIDQNDSKEIEKIHDTIKSLAKSPKCSFVYINKNDELTAISFDGTAGPLRITLYKE